MMIFQRALLLVPLLGLIIKLCSMNVSLSIFTKITVGSDFMVVINDMILKISIAATTSTSWAKRYCACIEANDV